MVFFAMPAPMGEPEPACVTRQARVVWAPRLSEQGGVGSYPDSLRAVLDEIDRRGGVEAVLAAAGVAPAQLDTLRRVAVSGPGAGGGG